MADMKIGWDSEITNYNDADLFTFPTNPKLFDAAMNAQRVAKELPYQRFHLVVDKGGIAPKSVILNGMFHGANKNEDMNSMMNYMYNRDSDNSGLLRFYHTNDKFFYCFGKGVKGNMMGGMSNFIPYIANIFSPIPFIYSDTERTHTETVSVNTIVNFNSEMTNDGPAPAHILLWTIRNIGTNPITKVEISDAANLGGNTVTWEGTLNQNWVLTIHLFKVVDDVLKMLYYARNGTYNGNRDFDGKEPPYIAAKTGTQTFSVRLTGNNGASTVIPTWRDTYWW